MFGLSIRTPKRTLISTRRAQILCHFGPSLIVNQFIHTQTRRKYVQVR